MSDRRIAARFGAPLVAQLKVTLRPGHAVTLIDIASSGALVHSAQPLRPGGRVHVTLTSGAMVMRTAAQVLRCMVVSVAADGVIYAGALRFEEHCQFPWELETRMGS